MEVNDLMAEVSDAERLVRRDKIILELNQKLFEACKKIESLELELSKHNQEV